MALFAAQKVAKKLKKGLIVVILPDSGKNYLTKFYNNDWMRDFGFLDEVEDTIKPLLNKKLHFISLPYSASPQIAIDLMRRYQISQIPVLENKKVVGTISERILIRSLFGKSKVPVTVSEIMDRDFIQISEDMSVQTLALALTNKEMVIVADKKGKPIDVLTRIDFLSSLNQI